jgi:hypothetical protein
MPRERECGQTAAPPQCVCDAVAEPAQLPLDWLDMAEEEVLLRFKQARRRGQSSWLWPEVPRDRWTQALCAIADAAAAILAGEPRFQLADHNADAIGLAGYTSGLGPLLGWWRERGQLATTQSVGAMLDLHFRHSRERARRVEARAVETVEELSRRGIDVLVLKGAHTGATYFPEPATRPASDSDLLVGGRDGDAAKAALAALGYQQASLGDFETSWRLPSAARIPRSLRLVHANDPWSIDLHTSLNGQSGGGAPAIDLDAARPFANASPWPIEPRGLVLRQPLLLHQLAIHAGSALQNLTLLRLVELRFVIARDSASGHLDWDEFLVMGRAIGSLGHVWPALKLCRDLVPGTVPDCVLRECEAHAPAGVRRVIGSLEPATAQRVDRTSIAEHFMWSEGLADHLRQFASDLMPGRSLGELRNVYGRRSWQLLRGGFSR